MQLETAAEGDADVAGLLADDDGQGIGLLADTHGGAVAQSEFLGEAEVVTDGEDAAGSGDAFVGDDHTAVVER